VWHAHAYQILTSSNECDKSGWALSSSPFSSSNARLGATT
jgi:hypothetical protein